MEGGTVNEDETFNQNFCLIRSWTDDEDIDAHIPPDRTIPSWCPLRAHRITDYAKILEEGTATLRSDGKNNRWFVYHELIEYRQSHLVWNLSNPHDEITDGYVIHHIDGDSTYDHIGNLMKMTTSDHTKLHNPNRPTLNDYTEARKLRARGWNWREISQATCIPRSTIINAFIRNNWEGKPHHRTNVDLWYLRPSQQSSKVPEEQYTSIVVDGKVVK
jgi:hypothetical protein